MSEAFQCDCCGEFRGGYPEMNISVEPRTWAVGGKIKFSGGVAPWNPEKTDAEICGTCAPAIAEAAWSLIDGGIE